MSANDDHGSDESLTQSDARQKPTLASAMEVLDQTLVPDDSETKMAWLRFHFSAPNPAQQHALGLARSILEIAGFKIAGGRRPDANHEGGWRDDPTSWNLGFLDVDEDQIYGRLSIDLETRDSDDIYSEVRLRGCDGEMSPSDISVANRLLELLEGQKEVMRQILAGTYTPPGKLTKVQEARNEERQAALAAGGQGCLIPSREIADNWIECRNPAVPFQQENALSGGKWLIFRARAEIDAAWAVVKKAVEDGLLPYAKVSTLLQAEGSDHVICVYTPNASDKEDCIRCRGVLRRLGFGGSLSYKPDAWTAAGKSGSLYYS